jgi:hypothetical protein
LAPAGARADFRSHGTRRHLADRCGDHERLPGVDGADSARFVVVVVAGVIVSRR